MNKIKILLALVLILSISSIAYALDLTIDDNTFTYEGPNVSLVLNGNEFKPSKDQMPPVIIENRTLVPVREVFEKLAGIVTWDNDNKKAVISMKASTIELTINSKTALVNGQPTELDVPAKIINNKTMVPVRFISENCGLTVEWNNDTKTVSITDPVAYTTSDNIVINALNNKYAKFFGEKKSKTTTYQLCNMIQTNNIGDPSHKIVIRYYGSNQPEQVVETAADIYTLTSSIIKTTRSNFNISGECDENGYINKINIERVDW